MPVEKVNPKEQPDNEFVYIDIASIDNTCQKIVSPKRYHGSQAPSRARQLIKAGDILFSTVRTYLKNIAIVDSIYHEQIASTGFCVVRTIPPINNKFVFYFVQTDAFLDPLNMLQRGTSYPAVRNSDVFSQLVPIAPFVEQRRIVSKIEELFTRLDAGVAALKKAKAQIKQYGYSLLKFAFEGKLTDKWRDENRHKLEPVLHIREKIRQRNSIKKGYNETASQGETLLLPPLPQEWFVAKVGDISEKIHYGSSNKATDDTRGIAVLRMGNIQDGKIIFENLKYYPKDWEELDSFLLCNGDILFNRTNSAELVGKSAVYKDYYPKAVFASYLIRIRVYDGLYSPDLLSHFINSIYGRWYIKSVISQQVGQANVNGTKLSSMPIPVPPIEEQREIVPEIERRNSIIDNLEIVIDKEIQHATALRQSILRIAFEGRLVSQNLDDEPASILLEKIHEVNNNSYSIKKAKNKNEPKLEAKEDLKQTKLI